MLISKEDEFDRVGEKLIKKGTLSTFLSVLVCAAQSSWRAAREKADLNQV